MSLGVAAPRAKRSKIFMLHIHGIQEAFSWHIGYNVHYVIHGYTHLLHREDQARLSLSAKLHVLSFFRTQEEAWGRGYASLVSSPDARSFPSQESVWLLDATFLSLTPFPS